MWPRELMMMPRRFVPVAAVTALLFTLSVFGAGELLSYPAHNPIGSPPADLRAQAVALATLPGQSVAGWYARGKRGAGAILLLHGIRGDRQAMLARAQMLHRAGYAVLLIDLPSHGQSTGERITFGLREADGVRAALAWLRQQAPGEKVGVIAVSLGAAALVLARPQPAPDAVVLESMFPTIEEAVTDRIAARLGRPIANVLAPLLLWQLPLRLGLDAQQLRPIDALGSLHAPLLIAAGTEDPHTPWAETLRLFAAAQQPKELWAVQGARHVDLHAYNLPAYEARVLPFLMRHLQVDVPLPGVPAAQAPPR